MTQPKAAPMREGALYIRVSSKDQALKFSPAVQLDVLSKKARDDGFRAREEFVFTDKQTGTNSDRPGFQRMLTLAKSGGIEAIFVLSVDRFARNTEDALRTARLLKEWGVRLIVAELPMDIQTPEGELAFTQFAAFAQFQAAQIKKYTRGGRMKKLEGGAVDHGSAPYGFRIAKGRFVIYEPEAKLVRRCFELRRRGVSLYGIASRLNTEGIPAQKGGRWSRTSLHQMLHNTAYKGEHVRCGVTISCPPIVEAELFDWVAAAMETRRAQLVGRPSGNYLLRGYLWSAFDGRRYIGNNHGMGQGRKVRYYQCGNVETAPPYKRRCTCRSVQADVIETLVFDAVWNYFMDPERVRRGAEAIVRKQSAASRSGAAEKAARKELARLRPQETRLLRMIEDGLHPYETGMAKVKTARARIAQLERELRSAGKIVEIPALDMVEHYCRKITEASKPDDCEGQRRILEHIVDFRVSFDGKEVDISGMVPVSSTGDGKKNWTSGFSG